mmetsp:Transcript_7324/g.9971  ORF Transcript_7324/g.9971 Transcript_7324/m.9971 type:complete len:159 (-) Transcript_7324:313-789(-)|eukprot:CAMPEP_0185729896 /NCGR_PEP_ID=MMETSP1171-20130828/7732_1 /TAXON_ID=374046 /ORGANISM="Helicotheca tamensis, Strain CCMP826" /LENGTH=158 /DNA_ID=CAMNT_0028398835 /DNA_START=113 /DNA_END=589 /DNA_ORIENTATION=+
MKFSNIALQAPLLLTLLILTLTTINAAKVSRNARRTLTGAKKSKGRSTKGSGKKGSSVDLDLMCAIFQTFQHVKSEVGLHAACPLFDHMDETLCPNEEVVQDICSPPYLPHLNPAVKFEHCKPLFEEMSDVERKAQCVRYCINYVSKDRGDCCEFECM